jgi:uncharacterized membrane protein
MTRLFQLLAEYWLLVALAAILVVAVARVGFGRKPRILWPAAAILLIGGYFLFTYVRVPPLKPWEFAGWVTLGIAGLFLLVTINLVVTGHWSRHLAWAIAALFAIALGGFVDTVQAGGLSVARSIATLEFVQPWWLLLLAVLPFLVMFSYRSLAGLGPIRRWVALSTRCLLVLLLVMALAEPRLRRPNENVCVLYVVDRSMSIPQEIVATSAEAERDQRWLRLQQFIHSSVQNRGPGHRNDLSGAILFARRPRLILPPSPVDKLVVTDALAGAMDPNYTDIAAAIKLAMASFPEDTGKRIVLLSDGNENLGNAEEQANLARQNGVQIDVIPLGEGHRHENEVLIQAVEAPPQTAKGARLPIRVLVRNAHPSRFVIGTLELLQNREGKERPIAMVGAPEGEQSPYTVRLPPGLTSFTFRDKAEGGKKGEEEFSYTYRAVFTPLESRDANNRDALPGLAGDRIQNNRGMAHVIARGARRVLFVEPDREADDSYPHQHLIDQLKAARYLVLPRTAGQLPVNKDELTVYLSNFDCLVIADVPAERFTPAQQEVIRSNTYDQGCGLVFVGGPDSYGAGGYQRTPIEAALPVDCEIKSMKAAGRGGLVLIMHASEMADGNNWQKKIAHMAIDRLAPNDMVGVLYYDGSTKWHVPFQQVGEEKARLKAMVDRMVPGDMMDFDPFLRAAHDTLADEKHALAVKHTIVISDGDPQLNAGGRRALADMKANNVSCTTVGVATHSAAEDTKLKEIADSAAIPRGETRGMYYKVKSPDDLPAIYMRESRRVSQSFLFTQQFKPKLILRSGATDKLDDPLPDLHGFVRTTMKPSALAEMHIEGPRTFDQRFPILATWQYGLGRSAAFTSDARTNPATRKAGWDRDWAGSEIYLKFWEQVVAWAMRGLETDRLVLTTEYREGKVRVVVEARDENNRPLTDLKLEGKVSSPGGLQEGKAPIELKFEQRAGGYYEAEFKAEEAGSYIVNAQAKQRAQAYTGRFRPGLPMTVTEKDGQLQLADGTLVRRGPDGKLLYADDGTPVKIEEEAERVVDSRRSGVTISYSPEFADLEANTAVLTTLARITGGNVYSEDRDSLRELAASGELYRKAPEGTRALLPLWYWLVLIVGLGLLLDVGVRRISLEPAEVRQFAARTWTRVRKKKAEAAAADDAFLARLRQKKAVVEESLERERAGRKFEATGPIIEPAPAGADETVPTEPAPFTPPPPPPPPATKPAEEPQDDYLSKLKRAKKRAPHERDKGEE